jgi:hypothetical protein
MVWSRCAVPPQEVEVRGIALPGVKDCPISGDKLPLVVISHGTSGSFIGHHDTADTLADAGFIVAAINHPGDTSRDMSRSDDLAAFVERPTDIKRLIEFMLQASPVATKIDPERIGFFGFFAGWLHRPRPDRCQSRLGCCHDLLRAIAFPCLRASPPQGISDTTLHARHADRGCRDRRPAHHHVFPRQLRGPHHAGTALAIGARW